MPKKTAPTTTKVAVPAPVQKHYQTLLQLTNDFCKEHLNEEYAELARKAALALCRKKPSPIQTGSLEVWAAGIVYALGTINFLFDKNTKPYLSSSDLSRLFNIGQSTASSKAKQVRDILKMHRFDYKWMLPSQLEDSIIPWMISVDGLVVDARDMPYQIQEVAFAKKLIPYIPALRNQKEGNG